MRKLMQEDRNEVVKVYSNEEVSYSLSDLKYAGLRFMYFTLHEAHGVYLRKCSCKRKVAEKTFESLKPRYVKTVQDKPLRGQQLLKTTMTMPLIHPQIHMRVMETICLKHRHRGDVDAGDEHDISSECDKQDVRHKSGEKDESHEKAMDAEQKESNEHDVKHQSDEKGESCDKDTEVEKITGDEDEKGTR